VNFNEIAKYHLAAMTDTQRIAIATLARAILSANLPDPVERTMLEAFEQWPSPDFLEVLDLVEREVACFAQVRGRATSTNKSENTG